MSLNKCLKKAGKRISQEDRAAINAMHSQLIADGVETDEAARRAIQSTLETAIQDRQALIDRIRSEAPPDSPVRFSINDRINKAIKPSIRHQTFRERFSSITDSIRSAVSDDAAWAMKQGIFDSGASVERLERNQFGKLLDAKDSAYKMYALSKNLPSVMQRLFATGVPVYQNGQFQIAENRKGLKEIFRPLFANPGGNLVTEWEAWAVANRSKRLIDEGRESRLTQEDIDELLTLDEKYDGLFSKIMDDWQKFNNQLLDLGVDRGAISQEMADKWRTNDYVPFYRAEEDLESVGAKTGAMQFKRGIDGQSIRSRRLKGADARVENVMQNMILNSAKMVDKIYKNEAMRRIVGLADGIAMERIPHNMRPIRLENKEIASALLKAGLVVGMPPGNLKGPAAINEWLKAESQRQVDAMSPDEFEGWQTFFRPVAPQGPNVVSVMENGRAVHYRVTDDLLLRTIQAMTPAGFSGVLGALLKGPRRLLTEMVTNDPGFMLANFIRDFGSTFIAVDANNNPVTALASAIGSAPETLRGDGLLAKLQAAGAMTSGFYDPLANNVMKNFQDEMGGVTLTNSPKKLYQMYRKIGMVSEQANRSAVAKAVLAKGGSVSEAAWQAQDVLNFNQSGDWQAVKVLTEMVPFMNARLQGLYKVFFRATTGSAAIGDPEAARMAFLMKGGALAALSMLMYATHYRDREEYERLPDWDKDTNWHVFTDDQHYRVPKPFELGFFFSTIPERFARLIDDKDRGKDTAESIVRGISDTLALNPIPQLVKPLIEQWANKSFFTGNPIVNMSLRNLSPEAQYHAWTSETARAMAQVTAEVLPEWAQELAPSFAQSPVRFESVVRAYTGTVGSYLLHMSDTVTRAMLDMPPAPTGQFGNQGILTPVVEGIGRRFVRGDPDHERSSRYSEELYKALDKANSAHATMNAYIRQGQIESARDLMSGSGNILALRKTLNSVNETMRTLNTMERTIRYSQTMSGDEKRERINEIIAKRNQLLERVAPILHTF